MDDYIFGLVGMTLGQAEHDLHLPGWANASETLVPTPGLALELKYHFTHFQSPSYYKPQPF